MAPVPPMQTTKYWAPWSGQRKRAGQPGMRPVVGHIGNESGSDGGLDDRGAVDADEPEQAHGAVDHSEADVAVGSGEQGLEHWITPRAKQKPKAARKTMSKTQKTVMQTEKGMMSLKVCEMLGGTCSGILTVMLRLMKNL